MGVKVSDSSESSPFSSQKLGYDAVVLAVGHSARDIYQMLLSHNMDLVPKDFSVSSLSFSLNQSILKYEILIEYGRSVAICITTYVMINEQVGLRVEHPQELINNIQVGRLVSC